MKKVFGLYSFIAAVVLCGLVNLILFFTVPDARLSEGVFWLVWSITFPVNLLIMGGVYFYIGKKGGEFLVYGPVRRLLSIGFCAYLLVGLILMYVPVVSYPLPIILESLITGVYLLALLISFRGMNYVADNQRVTKQKVLYIRLLQSDLESCFVNVTDPTVLAKLRQLSEKIRFSDPMSHPSLAGCESELSSVIFGIVNRVNSGELAGLDADITKASALIDMRNSRCAILK